MVDRLKIIDNKKGLEPIEKELLKIKERLIKKIVAEKIVIRTKHFRDLDNPIEFLEIHKDYIINLLFIKDGKSKFNKAFPGKSLLEVMGEYNIESSDVIKLFHSSSKLHVEMGTYGYSSDFFLENFFIKKKYLQNDKELFIKNCIFIFCKFKFSKINT